MNWHTLTSEAELDELISKSENTPQVIFKHSTSCSISRVVKNRLDKGNINGIDAYFLDLIAYRSISNKVAERLGVTHESPQILLVKNGKAIYSESHYGITV